MSSQLSELRDQVILDAGIAGNPNFPTPRLNRIINLAQLFVQRQLNALGMKKWEKSGSLSLSSGNFAGNSLKAASIPSDLLESPKSIKFIEVDDGSTASIAYEVDPDVMEEQLENSYLAPTISKPVFMRLANNIYMAPNTITSATAYYYKVIPTLSNDTDTTEIPVEYEEYIIKRAVMEIDSMLGKLQDKQVALADLQRDIAASFQSMENNMFADNYIQKSNEAKLQ